MNFPWDRYWVGWWRVQWDFLELLPVPGSELADSKLSPGIIWVRTILSPAQVRVQFLFGGRSKRGSTAEVVCSRFLAPFDFPPKPQLIEKGSWISRKRGTWYISEANGQ